ncbi:acyltransferase family protein [Alteromonas pelagimontana]|uniref:Acyltransferase family protein n=1 Tax=Alteromonas pelagimontana TaxID=1858656 RepID=A0A6M4MHB3_9ALTE|nr:acyltransferase family protein [Alteromonas pelagimontana]QJR81990.1 acyltransferase family protein [Alteromonas pelagimontana]
MTSSNTARLYYLDSMRAILMVLGVVMHSAQLYSLEEPLPLASQYHSIWMTYLYDTIHLFRMSAFFMVSGFFCYLTLNKYGGAKFLRLRLVRIAVPLITTIFTLNLLQFYFLQQGGWISGSLTHHFTSGVYIGHLWFLVNLLYYFIFSATLHSISPLPKARGLTDTSTFFRKCPVAILLLLLPMVTLSVMALNKLGIPIYTEKLGLFKPYSLLYYYVYFAFGYLLAANRSFYQNFMKINPLFSIAIIILGCLVNYLFVRDSSTLMMAIAEYGYLVAQWYSVALCFYLFSKLLDQKSHVMALFSEASYSVYLFHFIILILFSSVLVKLNFGPLLGTMLSIVVVTVCSFAIHFFIIRKFIFLRFLYNGRFY